MAQVNPIPDGYRSITPYLILQKANEAIEYYKQVLGAKERLRMPGADERIGHAELEIGDSLIMLADEYPDMGIKSPTSLGGTPVGIMVYVPDVDAVAAKAVELGGTITRPVENKFYGDRGGSIQDPFGHVWHIATHVEDVSDEELQRRARELAEG